VEGFRFGPPPAEPADRRRAGLPTGWIIGPVLGFTAAVLLLGGLIAAQFGARRVAIEAAKPAPDESLDREASAKAAAPNPGESPPSKEPEPARGLGPIAKAQLHREGPAPARAWARARA
jgi:hypothetical protein